MDNILIKGLSLPKDDEVLSLTIYPDGRVCLYMKEVATAIQLSSHEETDLDLYDYIKQGSSFIKLNKIASELSFLIHCFKDDKIGDDNVLGRLVAMRNAIWDSDKDLEKNNA